jgi:hypothetical protein
VASWTAAPRTPWRARAGFTPASQILPDEKGHLALLPGRSSRQAATTRNSANSLISTSDNPPIAPCDHGLRVASQDVAVLGVGDVVWGDAEALRGDQGKDRRGRSGKTTCGCRKSVKGVISPSRGAPGVFVDEAIKKWSTVHGARR